MDADSGTQGRLSPEQVNLVQSSFAHAFARKAELTAAFYSHLFSARPELRALFRDDLTVQREKLAQALAMLVRNLHREDELREAARALALRHVGYGVERAHYGAVGAALIAALRASLGARFTPAVQAAWGTCYAALSSTMIEAAHPEG